MLQEISIKHFAIIDDLQISFADGLNILSGETGAGKSIIINAVNLMLGSRASATLIRTGHETAELEALFQISPNSQVAEAMVELGYDPAQGLLIRRIISSNDRHKIYINGRMATAQILTAITENLASISGQHAHQGLLKEEQHLLILDQFGGLMPLRDSVGQCFRDIQPLLRQFKNFERQRRQQTERIELLEFQKNEIDTAAIVPEEDRILEQQKIRLKNAESLYQTVYGSVQELYAAQGAVVERLQTVQKKIEKAAVIDPELTGSAEALAESVFHLEDTAGNLRDYLQHIQMDDRLLEETESRLDTLNKLKRKYGGSLEAVFAHHEAIVKELDGLENLEETIDETRRKLDRLHRKLAEQALALSEKRKQAADIFARKVEKELATLEMPHTRFEVALQAAASGDTTELYLTAGNQAVTETGVDRAVFTMAPNPGESLKPLARIASGGELSRVVLALKAILAEKESLETVVFDEVDAGIGGGVAEVVGRKIASLARFHQIICITHLAQIAKFGRHHFKISKQVSDGRTRTDIRRLRTEERVEEIARMLGGVDITRKTLEHAREILETAE